MKHEYFEKELATIKADDIRKFSVQLLEDAPDYFYHVAASSTGKYHPGYALGEGGLLRHTKAVVRFFNHIASIEQTQNEFTERELDLGRVACIAHDILKQGFPKDQEEGQKAFTVFNHPVLAADFVFSYVGEFLDELELSYIADACKSHMGQWNTDKRSPGLVLEKPSTKMQKLVHLSDYLASRKDLDVDFSEDSRSPIAPAQDLKVYTMPFGKHKGVVFEEVPLDYVKWLATTELKEPLKTAVKTRLANESKE